METQTGKKELVYAQYPSPGRMVTAEEAKEILSHDAVAHTKIVTTMVDAAVESTMHHDFSPEAVAKARAIVAQQRIDYGKAIKDDSLWDDDESVKRAIMGRNHIRRLRGTPNTDVPNL